MVLSRREVTAIFAHLDDPWNRADWGRRDRLPPQEAAHRVREPWGGARIKLAAQLMYGSGLQMIATMIYLHVIKRPGAGAPSPLDFE